MREQNVASPSPQPQATSRMMPTPREALAPPDVARLLELRQTIAARDRLLAERKLDLGVLRFGIEQERRQRPSAAGSPARLDPAHQAHERESLELTEERDRWLAEAESLRFMLLFALERLRGHAGGAVSPQPALEDAAP